MIREIVRAIGVAVAEEQSRMRWLILQVVGAAIRMSEAEILAAVKNLTGIQIEAKQHVEDLESLVKRTRGEREVASQVISHQAEFCDQAIGLLRQQKSTAERAMALTEEIDNFVGTIGKIANAVRILTINGHIESTRLGNEGRAFAVIAEQMRELSEEVRTANERIKDLTTGLAKLIPVIVDSSRSLLTLTERFSAEHISAVSDFQTAVDAAQEGIGEALYETQERAQRLAQRTGQIMTHLQFQDRMAQKLRDIEHITLHTEKILKSMFNRMADSPSTSNARVESRGEGRGENQGEGRGESHVESPIEALGQARRDNPQRDTSRLGQQQTGGSDKPPGRPELQGGDVVLFP